MTPLDPASREQIADYVRACELGVVATVDAFRNPQAALVGLAALDDGTLIFDAPAKSRKIANIVRAPGVAVVASWNDDVSLQIEGTATVVDGEERIRYGTAYAIQFPRSRALDDDFAIVVIQPRWLRVYDATTHPARTEEARWFR